MAKLEWPINLTPSFKCFWIVGGSRRMRREPTQTQGEHENSTQTRPDPKSNPGPTCFEATGECLTFEHFFLVTTSFLFLIKNTNYLRISVSLDEVFVCLLLPCRYLNKQNRVALKKHWFDFTKNGKPGTVLLWLLMAEGQISRDRERERERERGGSEKWRKILKYESKLTALFKLLQHIYLCSKSG